MALDAKPIEQSLVVLLGEVRNEDELLLLSAVVRKTKLLTDHAIIAQAFEQAARIHRIPSAVLAETVECLRRQEAETASYSQR